MAYDLTSGITGFFSIFSSVTQWLKTTEFIIGSVTFSLWGLMWSLLLLSIFISALYKILGD